MNMYPYFVYVPDPYNVTTLDKSFPEHHFPLEHTRQKIGHTLHDWWSWTEPTLAPKADVRETRDNYYIDVELPGTESTDQVKVKWTNSCTLHIEALKPHVSIAEDAEPIKQPHHTEVADGTTKKKKDVIEQRVHNLIKERAVGKVIRAFSFPVKVNRDQMTAKLQNGLLILAVPKAEEGKVEHKEVEVKQQIV